MLLEVQPSGDSFLGHSCLAEQNVLAIPDDVLSLIFQSFINEKNYHYLHSIQLTSKKWKQISGNLDSIYFCHIAYQVVNKELSLNHSQKLSFEKIVGRQTPFSSEELKLIDRILKPHRNFRLFLNYQTNLFKKSSMFFSFLDRYSWKIEEVQESQDLEIKGIANDNYNIKNAYCSLISFFKRGLRYVLRCAQQFIEIPSLWSLFNCCVKLLE